MEVRAHAAHLDDADSVCTCCADQPSKRVQWPTGPWDVLRGQSQQPPSCETRQPLRTKAGNAINRSVPKASVNKIHLSRDQTLASDHGSSGGRHVANGERTATASAKPPTQGSKLMGSQLRGSTFRGKRRQHGAPCPLGTARLSARPQESSNIPWHRTTNGTSTGRSWDNRRSE